MTLLYLLVAALWLLVLGLGALVWALLRQIGMLHERIAPVGAMADSSGPRVNEASPAFVLPSLTSAEAVFIASGASRAQLLFFLSPTCPVCRQLLPVLASIARDESPMAQVILASDGEEARHYDFIARHRLEGFPYVLSSELGMTFRVQRLPYAVLIDATGVVRAKGLVNNREHLESLFLALEVQAPSIQHLAVHGPAR